MASGSFHRVPSCSHADEIKKKWKSNAGLSFQGVPIQAYGDLEHLETPYVVKLHRFTPLAPTQPVFTFEHPNGSGPAPDNSRGINLQFERRGAPAAICHGLAGYFDACLCAPLCLLLGFWDLGFRFFKISKMLGIRVFLRLFSRTHADRR